MRAGRAGCERPGSPGAGRRQRAPAVPADTAILAIGQQPREELLRGSTGSSSARTPEDRPVDGTTTAPRFYAAGDAVNGGATVVEAVREGKLAARAVDAELRSRT